MKIKKFTFATLCFLMIFALTGCLSKTAITENEFIAKTKNNGLVTTDVTSQYSSYGYISNATVAQHSDGWQIEFYMLDGEANAQGMFETNKTKFESSKGSSSTETSANMLNYSSYGLTSGGYYMYVCRVDNTLLYAKVKDTYKDAVKSLINDLGY